MVIDSNTFIFLNSFTKFLHVMLRKISFGASPGDDQACTYCIPSARTNQSVQDRAGEALGGPKANVSIYEARFESKVRF